MHTRRTRLLMLAAVLSALVVGPLFAGSEDDAIRYWTLRYEQAVKDLRNGNAEEKTEAAVLMGAHRKFMFVRPLAEELLNGLESPELRRAPNNDPYVKGAMAWALGSIGHKQAVPHLLKALEITRGVIRESLTLAQQRQGRARQEAQQRDQAKPEELQYGPVYLAQDRPGPFNQAGHQFGYSPDMFYSVSDEFKSMSVDYDDEGHRIRLQSHNYMNLLRQLMISLGQISDESAVDGLIPYLKDEMPMVRLNAALALGRVGTLKALSELEANYANEKDDEVRGAICYAILVNDKARSKYYLDLLKLLENDSITIRARAAVSLRDLGMGESVENLRAAQLIEGDPSIRAILHDAIHNAETDNILPVNY